MPCSPYWRLWLWNPAIKNLTKNSFAAHIPKIFPLLVKGKGIWVWYYLPISTSKYAMPSGQVPNFPYVNCIQLCVLHWVYKHEVWIPHELCLTTALNLQAKETWQALYAMVKMFVMEMSISWFQQRTCKFSSLCYFSQHCCTFLINPTQYQLKTWSSLA